MKFDWKKFLRALLFGVLIVLLAGIPLLYFLLMGMLGAFPLYVTCGVGALWGAALLYCILLASGYLSKKARRWLNRIMLCILAAGCLYLGHGFWRDSLPTLDDRASLLWQYDPFREDTKAVKLDEPSALRFTQEEWLRLDGATALYPVYAAFVQAVYPEPEAKDPHTMYERLMECTGTVEAYNRLIRGETDLIFAAAPSKDQAEAAARVGMEFHMTPIGREAFVFFVNSKNPVEGLTVEQIQGIYTGDITNWKEVGGRFQSIRPFQRLENSGSQSALLRLMDGLPLMEPEKEDRIAAMEGIITQVASYRNYSNALGFSFRFYSTEMVQNNDIRLLALNGVPPTKETIWNGSYPISSEFYAITAAPVGQPDPRETNPSIAAFLDWMTSGQGQSLVERTGYVSLK